MAFKVHVLNVNLDFRGDFRTVSKCCSCSASSSVGVSPVAFRSESLPAHLDSMPSPNYRPPGEKSEENRRSPYNRGISWFDTPEGLPSSAVLVLLTFLPEPTLPILPFLNEISL